MASVPTGAYQPHARDLDERQRTAAAQFGDKTSDLASRAGERIEDAMQSAERAAYDLAERGRDAGEQVGAVAGNFKQALDRSVRDQPIATLAVAAAMGFVLGALWKS